MKLKISLILFLYSALAFGQSTISNLPLKVQIGPSDYFVIEDDDATKRIKASTLLNFLPSPVQEITSVDGSILISYDPNSGTYDLSIAGQNQPYPVIWDNFYNSLVNADNTLVKTIPTYGFDSHAFNLNQQITGDFELEFTVGSWPSIFHIGVGDSNSIGYSGIIDNDFSLKVDEDQAGDIGHYVRENFIEDHQTSLTSGSIVKLRYLNGLFSYFVDGILIDTHALDLSANFPLILEANLYSPNSGITGATLKNL